MHARPGIGSVDSGVYITIGLLEKLAGNRNYAFKFLLANYRSKDKLQVQIFATSHALNMMSHQKCTETGKNNAMCEYILAD
jgi:hypothetical protein